MRMKGWVAPWPLLVSKGRGSRWIPGAAWAACLPWSSSFHPSTLTLFSLSSLLYFSPPAITSSIPISSNTWASSAQEANVNGYQTAGKGQEFRLGADAYAWGCVCKLANVPLDEYVGLFCVNHTSAKSYRSPILILTKQRHIPTMGRI